MNILTKEKVNPGRQAELDMVRGFTAMLLIIVHAGLYLGNNIDKGLWTFCDMTGSEPCAPVLMVLMGISMAYSQHQRPVELLKRGINLLLTGYALNFCRSMLPLLILGNVDGWASVEAFFVVDILQFAGLSFMLFALLKRLRISSIAILAVSIAMVIADQYLMLPDTVPWSSKLLTGLVDLFCPVSAWSCFPLLTWFVFPAFGLVFGEMLLRCRDKKKLYGILLPVGAAGTAVIAYRFCSLYPEYTRYYWGNNFYYMGLENVFLTILFIFFVLSCWFFAGKIILPSPVKKWLRFLSEDLNIYYIISWILISALIHVQSLCGWQFGSWCTIGVMLVLIVACAWITGIVAGGRSPGPGKGSRGDSLPGRK